MVIRSKLCGIRSVRDLELAVAAGADALGFISGTTHLSEDALSGPRAAELATLVPPYVSKVLVTHLQTPDAILALADEIGADTIQIHGLVSFETVRDVYASTHGQTVTKAIHVTGPAAVAEARRFASVCDAIHLDSRTNDRLGGTGQTHDWSISAEIVRLLGTDGRRCVLSGGLSPDNVRQAIAAVRPFAVDVNSGVENASGDKDATLVTRFVANARSALADAATLVA
jgi:phosphoribosylanthranilate isomerase